MGKVGMEGRKEEGREGGGGGGARIERKEGDIIFL